MLRVGGFVRLYAAFTQCDAANNPHGLKKAWTWLARWRERVFPGDFHFGGGQGKGCSAP